VSRAICRGMSGDDRLELARLIREYVHANAERDALDATGHKLHSVVCVAARERVAEALKALLRAGVPL